MESQLQMSQVHSNGTHPKLPGPGTVVAVTASVSVGDDGVVVNIQGGETQKHCGADNVSDVEFTRNG